MYFANFPITLYSLHEGSNVKLITNITLRAIINDDIKTSYSLYDEYDILDGETPELVADRFYKNPMLHWVVLLYNDIIDPRYGWPLSSTQLNDYVSSKYDNPGATHHYEDVDENWVNSDYPNAVSISNFHYEEQLNEKKRRIKLLKPQFINSVVNDFAAKLKS